MGTSSSASGTALTAEHIRAELDRLCCTLGEAGLHNYVAVQDLGSIVAVKGPPGSGLLWRGPATAAVNQLELLADCVGPAALWRQLVDR